MTTNPGRSAPCHVRNLMSVVWQWPSGGAPRLRLECEQSMRVVRRGAGRRVPQRIRRHRISGRHDSEPSGPRCRCRLRDPGSPLRCGRDDTEDCACGARPKNQSRLYPCANAPWPELLMNCRSEGVERPEKAAWRGLEGAQAYSTVRRAPERSTRCQFGPINVRSRSFMNSSG